MTKQQEKLVSGLDLAASLLNFAITDLENGKNEDAADLIEECISGLSNILTKLDNE